MSLDLPDVFLLSFRLFFFSATRVLNLFRSLCVVWFVYRCIMKNWPGNQFINFQIASSHPTRTTIRFADTIIFRHRGILPIAVICAVKLIMLDVSKRQIEWRKKPASKLTW